MYITDLYLNLLGMVLYSFNLSTSKAEAGRCPWVWRQSRLQSENSLQQNSETKIPKHKELNQIAVLDRGGQWNTIKWASGVCLILFNKNTFKPCWKYYAAIEG